MRKNNNAKYLWTSNGKIMLKVNDTYPTQAFTTHEEFEDYQLLNDLILFLFLIC